MATTARSGHKGRQRSAVRKAKAATQPKRRRGATNGDSRAKATTPAPKGGGAPTKRTRSTATRNSGASGLSRAVKRGAGKTLAELEHPLPRPGTIVRRLAEHAIARIGERARERSGEVARDAAAHVLDSAREAWQNARRRRLPIQRSLDIAAPLQVVWDEFSALELLPEGVTTIVEIERDGGELSGRLADRGGDWQAEILDERPCQSFAWQSHAGTDCAGLITFHALAERLTRLELNLDVVATGPAEALRLATRLADRRAEADLRRFKARVELINPDTYEQDDEDNADTEREQAAEA